MEGLTLRDFSNDRNQIKKEQMEIVKKFNQSKSKSNKRKLYEKIMQYEVKLQNG